MLATEIGGREIVGRVGKNRGSGRDRKAEHVT